MGDIKGPFWIEEWLDNWGHGTGNFSVLIGGKENAFLAFVDVNQKQATEFADRLNAKVLEWIGKNATNPNR